MVFAPFFKTIGGVGKGGKKKERIEGLNGRFAAAERKTTKDAKSRSTRTEHMSGQGKKTRRILEK